MESNYGQTEKDVISFLHSKHINPKAKISGKLQNLDDGLIEASKGLYLFTECMI